MEFSEDDKFNSYELPSEEKEKPKNRQRNGVDTTQIIVALFTSVTTICVALIALFPVKNDKGNWQPNFLVVIQNFLPDNDETSIVVTSTPKSESEVADREPTQTPYIITETPQDKPTETPMLVTTVPTTITVPTATSTPTIATATPTITNTPTVVTATPTTTPRPTVTNTPQYQKVDSITIDSTLMSGNTWIAPNHGEYRFVYAGGFYNVDPNSNVLAPFSTATGIFYNEIQWNPNTGYFSTQPNIWGTDSLGGFVGSRYWESSAEAIAGNHSSITHTLNAGDELIFIALDNYGFYYDNQGSVTIDIYYRP